MINLWMMGTALASPRPLPASTTLTIEGVPVPVHALPTGTVRIKRAHHTCSVPEDRSYVRRFIGILLDREWAAPMPVWTYAIAHPEGLFVVDAGATPDYRDDASWEPDRLAGWLVRSFIELDVSANETLPARLRALGLSPDDVRAVLLTHQHIDHTAAVPLLPSAEVYTTRAEDAMADQIGAMSWRWRPEEARVRHADVGGTVFEAGLGRGHDLTTDGSLRVVHTPGHTPGSVSVRLRTDQGDLWFTGDTAFSYTAMHPDAPTAGIHTDMPAVRRLQRVFAALRAEGALLLPAHDPTVPERLAAFGSAPADQGHEVPERGGEPDPAW